jgi:protein phosphatase
MAVVESAGLTDVGRKRAGNEDSFFLDDDMRFYVVADGMGGHKAGEVASKIVVESLQDHMQEFKGESKTGDMVPADETLSKEANHLLRGIHQANQAVFQQSQSSEDFKGMGSTVSAIYLTDSTIITSNVGDSPIYLIRSGDIETLYKPHTMGAEHAAIAPEGAKPLGKQFQHMLTRAMGVEENVRPDSFEIEMLSGDILVICSDGLSDNVSPPEIRDIVVKEDPEQACRSLVDLSNEIRGHDNITVIVLKIKELLNDSAPLEFDEPAMEPPPEVSLEKPKITVEYDTEDGSYQSFVQSLSLDGVFIETGESFADGQEVMMSFSVEDEDIFLMVNGTVTDRTAEGIKVKFEELSPEDQETIKSLIAKM